MAAILAVSAFDNEPQPREELQGGDGPPQRQSHVRGSPSELIWPLFDDQPNQSGSVEEYIDIP